MRKHLRMAYRMATEHGDWLRYVHGIGWHVWRGSHWRRDEKDAAQLAVIETKANAMVELATLHGQDRDELFADARMLDVASNIRGVISIATALPPFSTAISELDPDPYALNMPDGVYDLRTGELLPHDRKVMHTKVTGASTFGARSDGQFARFIEQVLPDPDVRRFAQKVLGYALLGEVHDQIFPIAWGEGGTGKSTFLDVVLAAFGSYGHVAPNTLLLSTGSLVQHPTEIADLRGQRLVVVHETEKSQVLKVAAMKTMTGKDRLKGRFMRQDFFEFEPSHTFMLVTNYPPVLDADDSAAWERIKVIPFTRKFRGIDGENTKLADQIIEGDLPSVMQWLIDGYALYETEGLKPPQAVLDATAEHNARVDSFSQFLDERTEQVDGAEIAMGIFTAEWMAWAKTRNVPPGKPNEMGERLRKRGFTVRTTSRPKVVLGLRWSY